MVCKLTLYEVFYCLQNLHTWLWFLWPSPGYSFCGLSRFLHSFLLRIQRHSRLPVFQQLQIELKETNRRQKKRYTRLIGFHHELLINLFWPWTKLNPRKLYFLFWWKNTTFREFSRWDHSTTNSLIALSTLSWND